MRAPQAQLQGRRPAGPRAPFMPSDGPRDSTLSWATGCPSSMSRPPTPLCPRRPQPVGSPCRARHWRPSLLKSLRPKWRWAAQKREMAGVQCCQQSPSPSSRHRRGMVRAVRASAVPPSSVQVRGGGDPQVLAGRGVPHVGSWGLLWCRGAVSIRSHLASCLSFPIIMAGRGSGCRSSSPADTGLDPSGVQLCQCPKSTAGTACPWQVLCVHERLQPAGPGQATPSLVWMPSPHWQWPQPRLPLPRAAACPRALEGAQLRR